MSPEKNLGLSLACFFAMAIGGALVVDGIVSYQIFSNAEDICAKNVVQNKPCLAKMTKSSGRYRVVDPKIWSQNKAFSQNEAALGLAVTSLGGI